MSHHFLQICGNWPTRYDVHYSYKLVLRCVGIGLVYVLSPVLRHRRCILFLIFIVFNCIVTCCCAWASSLLLNKLSIQAAPAKDSLSVVCS